MNRWPFHLAAGGLLGLFLLDLKFTFLGVSPYARLTFPILSVVVLLWPYLDGVMGSISRLRWSFSAKDGTSFEIWRMVKQANQSSDKALNAMAKEFPVTQGTQPTTGIGSPASEPWRDMIRVSDLMVRRLAERSGEDPNLLAEIPLPSAIRLAESKGKITNRQAEALNGFNNARQTLIEICLQLGGDTPLSVQDKARRLSCAGEQLVTVL